MFTPDTYANLDYFPIYLKWDAEREERQRERDIYEERMKLAAQSYDIDIHDEDSVWFRDTYTGPSERELMGGCNRCGGMDDCYCMECPTCHGMECTCPVPDFWQVLIRITHNGNRLKSECKNIWFTDEAAARARLKAITDYIDGDEITAYSVTIRPELVHEEGRVCQYCMGKGRIKYGEDEEPVPCQSCTNERITSILADYADPKWNASATNRHVKECAGWVELVMAAREREQQEV